MDIKVGDISIGDKVYCIRDIKLMDRNRTKIFLKYNYYNVCDIKINSFSISGINSNVVWFFYDNLNLKFDNNDFRFKDYFYTNEEIRKLKLEKLNEI